MALYAWKKLSPSSKKGFWRTVFVFTPLTFVMEYVFMWADVWNFSEAQDPLIGIWLWGVPIEEFSFWFAATPFILLVYICFTTLLCKRKSHARHSRI
jgi:lycopene cyclase domain-containing protein